MGYYLHEHSQALSQYNATRRNGETASGVMVVHTAESTPDLVGVDGGAEGVAGYITRRTTYGSYHSIVDSDSIIQMAPAHDETFHCRFTNPHSTGVSAACKAHEWHLMPQSKRMAYVSNLAKAAAILAKEIKRRYGVTVPARRISRAQALAQVPGFIGHGETDPTRRSDPGPSFDWDYFFAVYRAEMWGSGAPTGPVPAPAPAPAPAPTPKNADGSTRLAVDGDRGPRTISRWQEVMGTPIDGVISRPDSSLIRADQTFLNSVVRDADVANLTGASNLVVDGDEGPKTIKVRQFWLFNRYAWVVFGRSARASDFDGILGPQTNTLHQYALNLATRGTKRY